MLKVNNNWSSWQPMPAPENCRNINGPAGPGVYQIRHQKSKRKVQFGIGIKCQHRMKSIFPKPYGTGTRNNESKRENVLANWKDLEYRTLSTQTRAQAKHIEDQIKAKQDHLFNT